MKKVQTSGRKLPQVRTTDRKLPLVDGEMVAAALGAERMGAVVESNSQPFSLFVLRQELSERMRSSGGRPALKDTTRRQKIPLSEVEWAKLERLALACRSAGVRTTAGQIASVLLHRALDEVSEDTVLRALD